MKDRTGTAHDGADRPSEVVPVYDGSTDLPPNAMYRMGPEGTKGAEDDDWAPHRDLVGPDGTIELVFGGFVIRGAGDRVMLVDGGVGHSRTRARAWPAVTCSRASPASV